MNILYVTPYVPSPIRTRPRNLIQELVDMDCNVTLLTAASRSATDAEQARILEEKGIQVETFPISIQRSLANCLRALPTHEPLQAAFAYHPAMERRLVQLIREGNFDVVHVEHLRAARLIRAIGETPAVYDSVDCISMLFDQAMRISPRWHSRWMARLDLSRTRRYEAQILTRVNHVVVSSQRDKEALHELSGEFLSPHARTAPITVVTNGVDLNYFRPGTDDALRDPGTVVFTGKMSYHANVAAAVYFAHEVLPLIWDQAPETRFEIVGKDPPETIRQLATDGRITVTGYVDDLRPYLARATVAVCPVPYAVGVQFKVLEAMAMETPVICTSAAFKGLAARSDEQILVADTPKAFAAQALRVCADPAMAQRLGRNGRQYVKENHGWEAITRRLVDAYSQARSQAGNAA